MAELPPVGRAAPTSDDDDVQAEAASIALRQAVTKARILEIEERLQAEIEADGQDVYDEGECGTSCRMPPSPTSTESTTVPTPDSRTGKEGGSSKLEVRVNGINGLLCSLTLGRSISVREVKDKIGVATRIPRDEQRLFFGDCELEDITKLHEITSPSTPIADVSLVRRDPEQLKWTTMLAVSGMQLGVASSSMRAQRDLVLIAVHQQGCALQFASIDLRADREVVQTAVRCNGLALQYACEDLQSDRDVVVFAVEQDGKALQFASLELRADEEVVLLAAKTSSGAAFKFAAEELRADRGVVLQIFKEASGLALEFASWWLRADKEVVMAAVEENGLALEYASEELRADRDVVLKAVSMNGLALWDAADEFRVDPDMMAAARWKK